MIKEVYQFEREIEGIKHLYICDKASQTGHVKEFASELIHWAKQIEDNAAAQQQSKQAEEVPEPMPGVEVIQENPVIEVLDAQSEEVS